MSESVPSGDASVAPAATNSAPPVAVPTTAKENASPPPASFGSSRGSGLARGKRGSTPAAATQKNAPEGSYKPTAIQVVSVEREYKNPFAPEQPPHPHHRLLQSLRSPWNSPSLRRLAALLHQRQLPWKHGLRSAKPPRQLRLRPALRPRCQKKNQNLRSFLPRIALARLKAGKAVLFLLSRARPSPVRKVAAKIARLSASTNAINADRRESVGRPPK